VQEKHIFPFVGGTIRTNFSYAFVVMPVTSKTDTRYIEENKTNSAFLFHTFLINPKT